MEHPHPRFLTLTVKSVMCHTITYFVMGLLAFHFLHYADFINKPNSGMRPVSDPLVVLGPALQILRGVLFALVFYPFREVLFTRRSGWLLTAWMLIGVGILGTFAAAPGSFEGFIYTTVPVTLQVRGYLEIVPQTLLLSGLLYFWVRHPGKAWLTVTGCILRIQFVPMVGSFVGPRNPPWRYVTLMFRRSEVLPPQPAEFLRYPATPQSPDVSSSRTS